VVAWSNSNETRARESVDPVHRRCPRARRIRKAAKATRAYMVASCHLTTVQPTAFSRTTRPLTFNGTPATRFDSGSSHRSQCHVQRSHMHPLDYTLRCCFCTTPHHTHHTMQKEHWKVGGHKAQCASLAATKADPASNVPRGVKGSPHMLRALGTLLSRPPLNALKHLDDFLQNCDFSEGERRWRKRHTALGAVPVRQRPFDPRPLIIVASIAITTVISFTAANVLSACVHAHPPTHTHTHAHTHTHTHTHAQTSTTSVVFFHAHCARCNSPSTTATSTPTPKKPLSTPSSGTCATTAVT
jgi:hypothetical protein